MTTLTRAIHDSELRAVRAVLYERTGMVFPGPLRDTLAAAIAARAQALGLESPGAYARFLRVRLTQAEELEDLLEASGCTRSSFFHDHEELARFRDHTLPRLLSARAEARRLRIAVHACGTGEEAYTVAILIRDALGRDITEWRVEILATDVSARALDRAREGLYTSQEIAPVEERLRAASFEPDGARWSVRPELRAMITFAHQNLRARLAHRRRGPFDAALCRDTLRYFEPSMRTDIAASLAESLAPDGVLHLSTDDLPADLLGPGATLSPDRLASLVPPHPALRFTA